MSLVRRVARSAAIAVLALSSNGCFLFCIFSPGGCDAKTEQQITVAPSVTVAATPARIDVLPGAVVTATIAITVAGGPAGAALSLGGALPSGVLADFNPPTVTGNGTSTLTLGATPKAAPGLFTFDVVATGIGGSAAAVGRTPVTGEVLRPFRLLSPNSQSVTVGSGSDVAIGLTRATGFVGGVTFSVDAATVPAGTGVVFTPSTTSASSTLLRLDVPANATTGRYLVRTLATSGESADTVNWVLNVVAAPVPPDFSMLATPAAATVAPGGSSSFDLTLTRSAPGLGNIALAASGLPAGATATFTPSSVTGTTAQLTVGTSASTPDGSYPIVVTGTAGALVRQATVTLTVATPADFSMSVAPASLSVAPGASGQATVTLQRTGNPGAVTLDVVGLPAGVTAAANPASATGSTSTVTLAVGASASPGSYPLTVRGTAGSLTRTAPLTLVVPAPPTSSIAIQLLTPTVTIASGGLVAIPVRLTRTGVAVGTRVELRVATFPPGGRAWITPNFTTGDTATLQVLGGLVGNWPVVVSVALGASPPTAVATVNVVAATTPDFALAPTPSDLVITRGVFTPLALDIVRSGGFTGAVSLTAITDNPGNYAVNFSPASTTGNGVQVDVYASPNITPGPHVLILRGTSGGITRQVVMTLNVR
ncbi:MAG: hypothetical protein IPP20_01550 [Gemmatimonadetes bacterium]|nr:hypothetical protein [Gemmatimonadota bacterium]